MRATVLKLALMTLLLFGSAAAEQTWFLEPTATLSYPVKYGDLAEVKALLSLLFPELRFEVDAARRQIVVEGPPEVLRALTAP